MSRLNLSLTQYTLCSNRHVTHKELDDIMSCVDSIKAGMPLQYVLNNCEFMSLDFYVDENVLIPRQDTEALVEEAIKRIDNKSVSVLDICTGSGCIAISIAKHCKNAYVYGLDISRGALKIAEKNAKSNDASVDFFQMDILSDKPKQIYDVILSNPPYIESEVIPTLTKNVRDFEPRIALDGGEDGLLFYRRIIEVTDNILKPGGMLAFEISYNQGITVPRLMENKFKNIELIKDLCNNPRVVIGIKKGVEV